MAVSRITRTKFAECGGSEDLVFEFSLIDIYEFGESRSNQRVGLAQVFCRLRYLLEIVERIMRVGDYRLLG